MDFYSLGGSLNSGSNNAASTANTVTTDASTPETESYLRNYLKQYICDLKKVASAEKILLVEEDSRIQNVLQMLILEENAQAICVFLESVEEVLDSLRSEEFDLVIVNYYLADDEIDYDFWEFVREEFPKLDVNFLSHVNDREYYQMLEKIDADEGEEGIAAEIARIAAPLGTMTAKMKTFFGNIFGGRNGNQ